MTMHHWSEYESFIEWEDFCDQLKNRGKNKEKKEEEMTKKNQDSLKSSDGQNLLRMKEEALSRIDRPDMEAVELRRGMHYVGIMLSGHQERYRPSLRDNIKILDALIVKYGRKAKVQEVIDQIYDEAYEASKIKELLDGEPGEKKG